MCSMRYRPGRCTLNHSSTRASTGRVGDRQPITPLSKHTAGNYYFLLPFPGHPHRFSVFGFRTAPSAASLSPAALSSTLARHDRLIGAPQPMWQGQRYLSALARRGFRAWISRHLWYHACDRRAHLASRRRNPLRPIRWRGALPSLKPHNTESRAERSVPQHWSSPGKARSETLVCRCRHTEALAI